jgi:hypothetical protein
MEKNINYKHSNNKKLYIARPKNECAENLEHNMPGKKLFIAYPKSKIPPPEEQEPKETLPQGFLYLVYGQTCLT